MDDNRTPQQRPVAVEAVRLAKSYRSRAGVVEAVRGVDLQVHAGEVFGFLGPNGAGKSTTVRMLTTLLTITSGTARVSSMTITDRGATADHTAPATTPTTADSATNEMVRLTTSCTSYSRCWKTATATAMGIGTVTTPNSHGSTNDNGMNGINSSGTADAIENQSSCWRSNWFPFRHLRMSPATATTSDRATSASAVRAKRSATTATSWGRPVGLSTSASR